jgi:hypothetical protein
MNGIIDKRSPFVSSLMILSVVVCVYFLLPAVPRADAGDISPGSLVTDPLGVASFTPPSGWIRWGFWGTTAFSPTTEHNPKITFSVYSDSGSSEDQADKAMRGYVRAFSSENYVLVEKENLYLDGWSGVRVLARGTEKNVLFGPDYIWIQDYFTDENRVSLVFRSNPAAFETYRDTVLTSFRSLVIKHANDGL